MIWRGGRVAEGAPLLREYTGDRIGGSNPPLSALLTEQEALDQSYMKLALALAGRAEAAGDVPVGAVAVHAGRIVGLGWNRRERDQDPCAHAELIALRAAAQEIGHWRLIDVTLYVTLEPCPMCAGALVNSRVKRLVYGCDDPKAGAARSLFSIVDDPRLNHRLEQDSGVLGAECAAQLRAFFQRRRAEKKAARRNSTDP